MGIDNKYGQVELERGSVAADEPVFVLRAQDGLSVMLLEHYRVLCEGAGSPPHHLTSVDKAIAQFGGWQATHFTKVPESRDLQ